MHGLFMQACRERGSRRTGGGRRGRAAHRRPRDLAHQAAQPQREEARQLDIVLQHLRRHGSQRS